LLSLSRFQRPGCADRAVQRVRAEPPGGRPTLSRSRCFVRRPPRRSSAGRAPGPAHPPGPAQRPPAGGGGGRRAAPGPHRRHPMRVAPGHEIC